MRLKMTRRFAAVMMCALAVSGAVPAVPVFAQGGIHASGRLYASGAQSSNEKKMRDAAEQVQKAFDKQDLDKLSGLCNYPLAVSFADGALAEVQNKQEFISLGRGTIFAQGMLNAIAATNVAKLTDGGQAGAQMGGDYGLTLYKIKGKWKVNNFFLDAPGVLNSGLDTTAVNISYLSQMGEQIQKTFSYRDLETLSRMCNYPMVMSFADGTNLDIQTPAQLVALGEERVFTDKLSKAIDRTDVSGLREVGDAGAQMGGDSGLNMYKFNGYWKINQIYQ